MLILEYMFHFSPEITAFLRDAFELMEIRGRVGGIDGITFSVRTNEGNHCIPHVHAKCVEYEVSVAIETGEVLAGNLPRKNQKAAVSWVLQNQDKLMNDWRSIALSAPSGLVKSRIGFAE